MIPTPIRQVLSTIQSHGVQTLLMGGQACVFYGAAQVSKDIDLVLLADKANFERLHKVLEELKARRIAVPKFDSALLERGHAVRRELEQFRREERQSDPNNQPKTESIQP